MSKLAHAGESSTTSPLPASAAAAAAADIPAAIAVTKADLVDAGRLRAELAHYAAIGYPLHLLSAPTGAGLAALRDALGRQTVALLGPVNVGKSSLLNALLGADRALVDAEAGTITLKANLGLALAPGDQVQVGHSAFVFDPEAATATAAAPEPAADADKPAPAAADEPPPVETLDPDATKPGSGDTATPDISKTLTFIVPATGSTSRLPAYFPALSQL